MSHLHKRLLAAALVLGACLLLSPALASASTLRVSPSARTVISAGMPTKVAFGVKTNTSASVRVVVYRSGHAIRTLVAKGSRGSYSASWNLRTSSGARVAPGTYTYRATARRKGRTVAARRSVTVPVPISLTSASVPTRWLGVYMPSVPTSMTPALQLASELGHRLSVVNFFVADTELFPTTRCQNAIAGGAVPMVTLEMWSTTNGGLSTILNGSEDDYLRRFADHARDLGSTVLLRPFHEMNGGWYPWGATGSNTPAQLVAAYRHMHDIFVQEGATNVRFVWCPNVDFPVAAYYPGDAYVDYAAMDGYNPGTPWRSFASIFGPTYLNIASVTSKPMFIAETGCSPTGGDKAAWINDMFHQLATGFPRLEGVCWFDANKEQDWRIDSSSTSLSAFAAGLAAGY